MRKFLNLVLMLSLMSSGVFAQSAAQPSKASTAVAPVAKAATANDELIAMLPASDFIAVLDVNRAFNELLPKLAELSVGGVDKLAKQLTDFTQRTGIDPSKIQNAVLGLSMEGTQASGVILLRGLDADAKQVEAVMKELKAEFKTSDYKGKTIYNILKKTPAPSAGPVSVKSDEWAFVALGAQRLAVGDLAVIKKVIDIQSGAEKGGVSAEMTVAINETRASALVRFALNIPESLRAQAIDQGDLFKSVATIKMILGTFDAAADLSLSLDAVMRTPSQTDAGELENSLKGLLALVQGIFGGGDAKTDWISQLLAQIKIGSKLNDVSLSISLPRSLMEQLSKKTTPAEKK